MLTEEQKAAHATKVTASFVPSLMAGEMPKIVNKWMQLVGHRDYVPEDLSDVWPVQYGSFTEPFALDWHERMTGMALIRRQEVVHHPVLSYVSCSLDAYRREDDCAIDCKTSTAYRALDDILSFYVPQLIVQRACVQCAKAALLIVHGGTEPKEHEITWEPDYEALVWERIAWFWECVEDLAPPGELPTAAAPVPAVRTVDMTGDNEWADHVATYLETLLATGKNGKARDGIKSKMPPDVKIAHGHGIRATRNALGAIRITVEKE